MTLMKKLIHYDAKFNVNIRDSWMAAYEGIIRRECPILGDLRQLYTSKFTKSSEES